MSSELAADAGKITHDGPIQGEKVNEAEEIANGLLAAFGIPTKVDPFAKLKLANDADGQAPAS